MQKLERVLINRFWLVLFFYKGKKTKEIDYYKSNEVLENKFYQISQELFVNSLYKNKLNSDSKILYSFLLDRLSLSQKNHWFDELGRVYLIFTREEVQNKLSLSEKTVTKAFKQLTNVKLIEEKRQGLGKPNLIYIGKIQHEEIYTFSDTENLQVLNRKIYGSGDVQNTSNIQNAKNYLMICLYNNLGTHILQLKRTITQYLVLVKETTQTTHLTSYMLT